MKANRTESPAFPVPSPTRTRTSACTVSAAALMLGVSQAATIGINFPVDWTDGGAPSYTGAQITATALGIPVAEWQSLTPTPTGYNKQGANPGPFTFDETISTASNTNGLHPLPSGSLSISWIASAANTSGFGDASNGGAYGGNHPHIGDQQAYYGFLRDDVFLYTSPTSNPGYSVTITGLKSVFTNTPFVIQVLAATDTATSFTNAIVKSAGGTQALTYSASRSGNGILGGASTVSSPVNDDVVTISGAPALKDESDPANVVHLASTLSAILITDKPVIQRSPISPVAPLCSGTNVDLTVTAFGVPPLSYQWRKNGVALPSATNSTYSISQVGPTTSGYYDVTVSNAYGTAVSAPAAVTGDILVGPMDGVVLNSKPQGVRQDGLVHGGVGWQATSGSRTGVATFSATNPGYISIPGETNLDSPTGTITFWVKSAGNVASPGNQGAILLDRGVGAFDIFQADDGTLVVQPPGGGGNKATTTGTVNTGDWVHVAVVYDQTDTGTVDVYLNGQLDISNPNASAWSWPAGGEVDLGQSRDAYWHPLDGALDDVRIYSRALTAAEIATVATTAAVVDPSALQVWLGFDAAPAKGLRFDWTCGTLQSATQVKGPFTDVSTVSSPWAVIPTGTTQYFRTKQ